MSFDNAACLLMEEYSWYIAGCQPDYTLASLVETPIGDPPIESLVDRPVDPLTNPPTELLANSLIDPLIDPPTLQLTL